MSPHPFAIQPGQHEKIRRALKHSKGCRVKVKKGASANGHLLVSPTHLNMYKKAPHGSIVNLAFKHEDLKRNHRGGFLPLLAAALAPVIGGVAGGLIDKAIAGSGIRGWKKGRKQQLFTIEKHGAGMFLNPWHPPHRVVQG